jgi:hypothetical protein
MHSLNLIWQTQKGDYTTFEYEYLTEILFAEIPHTKIFDYGSLDTVLDNSVIIYSNNQNEISSEFQEYLDKFVNLGYKFYLFHLSNENFSHNCEYYKKANHVFRNYFNDNVNQSNVTFVPLGFKSGFYNSKKNLNDCNEKHINITFIGQPKSDRFELLDVMETIENNFIHTTQNWNCVTSFSPEKSIEIYKKTKYAPCPMGFVHPDSFRICEVLEWGVIPIIKKYEGKDYFQNIFPDHPFPVVDEWSQVDEIIKDKNYCKVSEKTYNYYSEYMKSLQEKIKKIVLTK